MKIEKDTLGNCQLMFERRDQDRELLKPIKALYIALMNEIGGFTEDKVHELDEFLRASPYVKTEEKARPYLSRDKEGLLQSFYDLDDNLRHMVIRRLYAVVSCYCQNFTI